MQNHTIKLLLIFFYFYFSTNSIVYATENDKLINFQFREDKDLKQRINEPWRWVKFNTESGLPSNKILKIVETPDGLIWACSSDGFAWYDGFKWNTMNNSTFKFPTNSIANHIHPDNKNGLILCSMGGIFRIFKDSLIKEKIIINGQEPYIHEACLFNNDGWKLICCSFKNNKYSELFIYKDNIIKQIEFPEKIPSGLNTDFHKISLQRYYNGDIYITLKHSIYKYNFNKWTNITSNSAISKHILNLRSSILFPFGIFDNGEVMFGAINSGGFGGGIWKFNNQKEPEISLNEVADIKAFDVNNHNEALAYFFGGIIYYLKNFKWQKITDFPDQIENIFNFKFSSSGDLWVATEEALYLCKLSKKRWQYLSFEKGSNNKRNYINELILSNDKKIVYSTGSTVEEICDNKLKNIKLILNNNKISGITGLEQDNEGNYWIGSGGSFPGLYNLMNKKWTPYRFDNNKIYIHKIKKDNKGNLWFLSLMSGSLDNGYGAFYQDDGKLKNISLNNGLLSNRVYDFVNGKDNSFWFATYNGISRLKNNIWKYWTFTNGLRFDLVYTMSLDSSGKLWFSDKFNGVGYIQNDSIYYVSALDKAGCFTVRNISTDEKGRVWIGTENGLFVFKDGCVAEFNKNNGLSSNRIWPMLFYKDNLIIGTLGKGISILNFEESKEPLPKIFLNQPIQKNEEILFRWKVFSYYGQIPESEIKIRYQIDNSEWSEWQNSREAVFSNLSYGKHTFKIQSMGLFADYDSNGVQIDFIFESPFYYRAAFLIPVITLLITSFSAIAFYFNKRRIYLAELEIANKNLSAIIENTDDKIILINKEYETLIRNSSYYNEFEKNDDDKPSVTEEKKKLIEKILSLFNFSLSSPKRRIYEYDTSNVNLTFSVLDELLLNQLYTVEEIENFKKIYEIAINPIINNNDTYAISIFIKDITKRKLLENHLKSSIVERETLLREIHHRVKNNLQIITSLLAMQKEYIKDEDALKAFQDSQNRIKTMALIHEKLFKSKNMAQINVNEYFSTLIDYLKTLYVDNNKDISLIINIDPVLLPLEKALHCGLIMNELVSNAFKHAFTSKKSGKIIVSFNHDYDDKLKLSVKDNGIGLPELFSLQDNNSLGIQLINLLLNQLHGNLSFSNINGTCFELIFPDNFYLE